MVTTLECRAAIRRDLNRLEKWADKNLNKFSKRKWRTPYHHTGWGIEQLCRKDLGHPSGPQVKHESAACPCGDAFSRCILGCISKNVNSRLGAIIVLCPMLVRLSLGHCIQFGALQKKNLDLLEWMQQRHQDGQRTAVHEKAERTVLFSPKKRRLRGDLVPVFRYILIKDTVEDGSRLILEGHSDRMRGKPHNL